MTTKKNCGVRVALLSGAAAVGLCAFVIGFNGNSPTGISLIAKTYAMEQQSGGSDKGEQNKGAGGKKGGKGGSESSGGAGGVPKGPSSSTSSEDGGGEDAKGPQYKGGGEHGNAESGVRPPWAQEGIPSVELGRLNVAKAPAHVLTRSLDEIYLTNLDKNEDGILDEDADLSVIDSPIANLALLAEALAGDRKVDGTWTLQDGAVFLGTASDKYIPVNTDTVIAITTILGFPDYDFSTFSYNRAATYTDDFAKVFDSEAYVGTGIEAFAQAADDARAVIVYYHDL